MRTASLILLLFTGFASGAQQSNGDVRTLIVIFDGLRPDYITPEHMPNLYSLKQSGSYVPKNHSVYPTVTRVNASSYATGSYPSTHGLMGNSVFIPEVDESMSLNTGNAKELMRISRATGNHLLTATSLGEILEDAGSKLMVFSSGSSGQAFLQNHTIGGGGVVNPELILPETLRAEIVKKIGPPPASGKPNFKQHDWASRAFLHYGLADDGPLVSAIWFSDPDGTAHTYGIGSPQAMESIKAVDEQFGFIIRQLKERNWIDRFNIVVTADHGFVTQKGKISILDFLIDQGLKKSKNSDDIILAGNAIYVRNRDRRIIKKIVSALQAQPWVGAIFTEPGVDGSKGWVDGTLSFHTIHWSHDRSADILVDYDWDDEPNEYGYKGISFAPGVAGHGGSSPYEITIPLVAYGPAFRAHFESSLPTSNTDIVPTILHYYGIPEPESMSGRVLHELLADDSQSALPHAGKGHIEISTELPNGDYRIRVQTTGFGNHQYVDFIKAYRDNRGKKQ